MFGPKLNMPTPPAQTPVPQPDDPALIKLQQEASIKAQAGSGFEAAILAPARQNANPTAVTKTQTLGYG